MVRSFLIPLVIVAAAFAITASLLSGLTVSGGVFAYLWIALLFGIVNAIVGTIIRILTFPLFIVTLGLSSIIVNAVLLAITAGLSDRLTIDHFWWTAVWGAIILSIVTVFLDLIVRAVFKDSASPRSL